MRVPAIILISLLAVVAGGLHFLFFGRMSREWQDYSQKLVTNRRAFMQIAGRVRESTPESESDDATELARLARKVQNENKEYRRKLVQISETYQVMKESLEGVDLEQEILDRLRKLEELETSTAKFQFDEASHRAATRITVLKNWGVGSSLQEEPDGNRFLHATRNNERTYAADLARISTASGTFDLMVRPYGWNGADDDKDRTILFAQGSRSRAASTGPPKIGTMELTKTAQGRLEYTLASSGLPSLVRSADISNWKDGEWHRVTVTWSKSPQETELYIDGKRAAAFEPRTRLPFSSRSPSRTLGPGTPSSEWLQQLYGGLYPGPYGAGRQADMIRSRRTLPSTSAKVTLQRETVPLPDALDTIVLGALENEFQPADMDIDSLFILNRPVTESELASPMQLTKDTLLHDSFQTPYGDVQALRSALRRMAACLRLINDQEAAEELRQSKESEYRLLKKSIGLDDEKVSKQDVKTIVMVQILTADQIHRLVKDEYTLDQLKKILRVFRHVRGDESEERGLSSMIGFLSLIGELIEKAQEDQLAELAKITILGESYVVSDKDLREQFERHVRLLREELGMPAMPGGETGGMPSRVPMGMPQLYHPGGQYPPSSPYYPSGPGGGYGQYPGMQYPPMLMYPYGMGGGMTDYREFQKKLNSLRSYERALAANIIPPDVRAELAEAEQAEGFYTRRILQLEVLGKMDYLPKFLYDVEYRDRLTTIQSIGLKRESEDLIGCTLAMDVHFVSPRPPEESATTAQAGGGSR